MMSKKFAIARRSAATAVLSSLVMWSAGFASANVPDPGHPHPLLVQALPQAAKNGAMHTSGRLNGSRRLDLAIHLPASNQSDLDELVRELYDPASPNYHNYLSVEEFTARFGPTQSDYDEVVAWANAQGLTVTRTTPNRHLIDVSGSVDDINRALNVVMSSYQSDGASGKSQLFAPDREPSLSLSVPILQITGLDNFNPPQSRLVRNGPGGPVEKAGGSGPGGEFLPSDMRAAYYGSGPLTGAGQTIGIFSFDGYISTDVAAYYSLLHIASPNVPVTNILVNGYAGTCDAGDGSGFSACDDGEQILDITNSVGMAPGASEVLFYEGSSGPDILNQMATDNLAKIISCSWGSGDLGGDDVLFQEFEAQGQTYANATGDNGSYNANSWSPPSLNPRILQVGGTRLTTTAPGGSYTSETGWPDSGGGFFAPAGYALPDYQMLSGVVTATNGASSTLRNDPDVSAEANFDNPTISNGSLEGGFGGTSFAAPRWAGYIALLNEQSVAENNASVGFVNPSIYTIATGTDYNSNFHDVKTGNNGFRAGLGYDLVTGWGSPNGPTLIDSLSAPLTTPSFVVSAYPSMPNLTRGTGVTTTVRISTPNAFAGDVTLSVSGLPSGVTAVFSPTTANAATPSTLTLTAAETADTGEAAVTITGTAGAVIRTIPLKLTVGDAPHIELASNPFVFTTQPNAKTLEEFDVSDDAASVPLTYTINAFASTDGSCTGSVPWISSFVTGTTVAPGLTNRLQYYVHPGVLAVGTYQAEFCITSNDPSNASFAVPITMSIVAGPSNDGIFRSGFEVGETPLGPGFNYTVDQPVEDDQAGSALDLATGSYHTWSAFLLDNINLYDDGTGLQVYWYNDQITGANKTKVGGVYDSATSGYAVLHSGDTVGPASTFNRTVTPMKNWQPGVDGYIGIAFVNSQTGALNYGYIHMTTTGPTGFPAEVLEYGFNNTGAAITIP